MNRPAWSKAFVSPAAAAAAPGLLVLAALAAAGVLDWGYALLGGVIVVAGGFVAAMAAGKTDGTPKPTLDAALATTIRSEQTEHDQLCALVAGNEAVLASLPDPLLILDRRRRIVQANPAVDKLFGSALAGRALNPPRSMPDS